MPNLNVENHSNSFYIKKMIAGSLATATGLLLTGLTISSVLSFYDNSKNSQSLSDKLYTART